MLLKNNKIFRKSGFAYVTKVKDNREYSIIPKTLFSMGKKFKLKKRQFSSSKQFLNK